MQHWHREHFSTHRFYADVMLSFAKKGSHRGSNLTY